MWPDIRRQILEMGFSEMHVRNMIFKTKTEIPLTERQIINQSLRLYLRGDTPRFIRIDTRADTFISRHFQADNKIGAAALPDAFGNHPNKASPVFNRSAKFIVPVIRPGRQKLCEQVSMCAMQFHTIETGSFKADGNVHIPGGEIMQFLRRHDMRHGPAECVGPLGYAFGRPHRCP